MVHCGWIIQEASVNPNSIVRCGDAEMSLDVVFSCLRVLSINVSVGNVKTAVVTDGMHGKEDSQLGALQTLPETYRQGKSPMLELLLGIPDF